MRRIALLLSGVILAVGLAAAPRHLISRPATNPDFVHFESGQVHPATITPSGDRLLVVNTPDNRLSVFDLTLGPPSRNTRIAEVPVGMEPVAVAALDDSTAWVVNNLSDDVSVVNLNTMHVTKALRVGDEPNDVVFAGTPTLAYVSVSNEDVVKVFNPSTRQQVAMIPVLGRMPRALARNAAGTKVFVTVFQGGNKTSILTANKVPDDSIPQEQEFPPDSIPGHGAPKTGFIVQYQNSPTGWYDTYGNLWNSKIKYLMADADVAEINTATNTVSRNFGGIGTNNFGIAVSPTDGRIAVSATDSRNIFRFEPRLSGYLVETRVGYVSAAGVLSLRILNPQIDYTVVPGTQAEADSAIGTPTGIAFSSNGARTYVTSMATNKLAVLNTFTASNVQARVPTVAGPTGVVVDDARGQIYIVGRERNVVQTLSSTDFTQLSVGPIGMDPTPDAIVNGRKFFYGGFTSAHGDQSCASCHIFGESDNMVWDLGDPFGAYVPPPSPNPLGLQGSHPMKGPMATQTLRGLTNTEPFHWRGDRANLAAFNGAIVTLMGREAPLADSEMTAFSDFVMPMTLPPNPAEALDRTMPDAPSTEPSALRGETFFFNTPVDGIRKCVDCHSATSFGPGTNRTMVAASQLFETQDLKVPQLRTQYRKTGFRNEPGWINKRGFGYTHDGGVDSLFNFLHAPQFDFGAQPAADGNRRDLEAFLHAFDTGTAPAVGYQMTFDGANNDDLTEIARMDTLEGQAALDYCDLIAKGRVNGQPRGWEYVGGGVWKSDKASESDVTSADLRALGGLGSELTVTGVPKGSGHRMGIDRDRDGYLDGDELDALSDPGSPDSNPTNVGVGPSRNLYAFSVRGVRPNPFRDATELAFTLGTRSRVSVTVYDIMGRQVRGVARGLWLDAGPQSVRWDGRDASGASAKAGVYFIRLETEHGQWTRAAVRIR